MSRERLPPMTLDDIPLHWGTTDWYGMALRWGIEDRTAMLRALALVDATYAIADETGVDFSTVCDLILYGTIQYADLYLWGDAWRWRLKLSLLTNWRSWRWCARRAWRRASARVAARITRLRRRGSWAVARLTGAGSCRVKRERAALPPNEDETNEMDPGTGV